MIIINVLLQFALITEKLLVVSQKGQTSIFLFFRAGGVAAGCSSFGILDSRISLFPPVANNMYPPQSLVIKEFCPLLRGGGGESQKNLVSVSAFLSAKFLEKSLKFLEKSLKFLE